MSATPPTPPAATPPPAGTPAAGPKQTTSIIGFVLGLAAFVFGWVFILGILLGVAAIIVSLMAKGREPGAPKWMWIVGLVGGIIGALVGLIVVIVTVGLFATAGTLSTY